MWHRCSAASLPLWQAVCACFWTLETNFSPHAKPHVSSRVVSSYFITGHAHDDSYRDRSQLQHSQQMCTWLCEGPCHDHGLIVCSQCSLLVPAKLFHQLKSLGFDFQQHLLDAKRTARWISGEAYCWPKLTHSLGRTQLKPMQHVWPERK